MKLHRSLSLATAAALTAACAIFASAPSATAPDRSMSDDMHAGHGSGSASGAAPGADGAMCAVHTSGSFAGPKVSTGTVTHEMRDGRHFLTLSADFVVPEAPAPHWQVVDGAGNVHFLQRLLVKAGDGEANRVVRSVEVPQFVSDVKSVRIWCSWAEVTLGEASFAGPLPIGGTTHLSGPFSGRKVNRGAVSHERRGDRSVLVLTEDFVVPDSPAPHWQVVDSAGRTYLLDSLRVKDGERSVAGPGIATDRVKRELVLPDHVPDVAKVQFWCAWAETLLGEATFPTAVR